MSRKKLGQNRSSCPNSETPQYKIYFSAIFFVELKLKLRYNFEENA